MERARPAFRPILAALGLSLGAASGLAPGAAGAQEPPWLGSFGLPGLVDMPTGAAMAADSLALTLATFPGEYRGTLAFQAMPRITAAMRYVALPDGDPAYFDRSFDLRYQIATGANGGPAVALGLMDFGGTGQFASEYLAATQRIGTSFEITGGIAWGRMATRGGFENPLTAINDDFAIRPQGPGGDGGITETGRLEPDRLFRGDAAIFGGLRWSPREDLSLAIEYSTDAYGFESRRIGFQPRSPVNVSASWRLANGGQVSGAWLYGTDVMLSYAHVFRPGHATPPGGRAPAPPPLQPRPAASAADLGWDTAPGAFASAPGIETELAALGLHSLGLTLSGDTATLRLDNPTYQIAPQAIGRAARVLANGLPARVERIEIVPVTAGLPVSRIGLARRDLEALEHAYDGAWTSFTRATIDDAWNVTVADGTGLRWHIGLDGRTAYFDPDAPVRYDFGLVAQASWSPRAGLVFSGQLREPLYGNLDQWERRSNSVLPHVRSDAILYDIETETELTWLTVEHFFRPGENLYGRVTAGLFERMYGGLSAELLWAPAASRLALGAEINYAVQRDHDGFGFLDYETVTGHGSLYYDLGEGYFGQIDAGRYLAGDWGATLRLDRRFDNGVRIGAFFTLTDVPFDEFGEGSFDKGIIIDIPIEVLAGSPTRARVSQVIRPISRDGGARLDMRNRLYDLTQDYREESLGQSWGRFWR